MFKRLLLSGLAILIAWTVLDVLMHRLLLRPVYEESAGLWRSFDQMNGTLIYVVTLTLIATFVATYRLSSGRSRWARVFASAHSSAWRSESR
jgi:hypothetical protein